MSADLFGRTHEEWAEVVRAGGDRLAALTDVKGIGDAKAKKILVAIAPLLEERPVETEAPEVEVEAVGKICAGEECEAVLSPEAVEKGWKYCPACNRKWLKEQGKGKKRKGKKPWISQEQVEKSFVQVQGILNGIKGRLAHDPNGRPWGYNYAPADVLFQLALARYKAGEFGRLELVVFEEAGTFAARLAEKGEEATAYETLSDLLYQGVLGEANKVTAKGDLAFVERLIGEGEVERTEEIQELLANAVYLLKEGKSREAAKVASEAKGIAGRMRHQMREAAEAAERADFLEKLQESSQPQKQRGRGGKGGGGRGGPRRPKNRPHQRHGRGMSIREIVNQQLAKAEEGVEEDKKDKKEAEKAPF